MDISNLLIETIVTSIPSIIIFLLIYFIVKRALNAYIETKMYAEDKFRQNIEKEISILNEKISRGEERFKKINHLLLDGNQKSFLNAGEFLERMGIQENIKIIPKSVFVLAPLNPDFNDDYEWVKDAFSKHKYICTKGDDVNVNENLLSHIISEMLSSTFVLANITGRNANVYYELGIAHALGKDIILISRSTNDIAFDLSSSQVIIYKSRADLSNSIDKWLISTFESKIKLTNKVRL